MKTTLKMMLLLMVFSTWSFACSADEVVGVKIEKMQFVPQTLKIRVGTTVTWINMEKYNNHSVYFQQESLPESDRLFPGETWQRVFDKPGVYPYVCGPHPEMTGTIEVVP
jgi:plastocyanin